MQRISIVTGAVVFLTLILIIVLLLAQLQQATLGEDAPTSVLVPTFTNTPIGSRAKPSASAQQALTAIPSPPTSTPLPPASTATPVPPTPTPRPSTVIIDSNINVRQGPGTNYAIIGGASADQEFVLIGTDSAARQWFQIDYNGQLGWVYAPLVTAINARAVKIVAPAPAPLPATKTPGQIPAATALPVKLASREPTASPPPVIGEEPALKRHIQQDDIEAGHYTLEEIVDHGRDIFTASFNTLDGAGRPEQTGTGAPREQRTMPENFNRISAPDANACSGCHNLPAVGGGGDNVANVFVLAQAEPFVNFDDDDTLRTVGNERNTPSLFGAGFIELLAREMTVDLHKLRRLALALAAVRGRPVTLQLITKGVHFGSLTAMPDGSVDATGVQGVDPDLVVRPFHQKGVAVSLREFTNRALLHHHGMLSVEMSGPNQDPDGDGYVNELTAGDVTAVVVFQATLQAPTQTEPATQYERDAVARGRTLFDEIQCSQCHIPALPLASLQFSEPGPFNPASMPQTADADSPYRFALSPFIGALVQDDKGNFLIPVFTDLKRHAMGEILNNERLVQADVPTDTWLTRKLWGFASEPPFLHHGRATLISEAILAHGGEAATQRDAFANLTAAQQADLIEFLLTLRIEPDR